MSIFYKFFLVFVFCLFFVGISSECTDTLPFAVNVMDAPYNAVGDGVNDDTQAINDSLHSGAALVVIPEGDFLISQLLIPSGVSLQGAGMASSPNAGTRLLQMDGVNDSAIVGLCISSTAYWHWSTIKDLQIRKVSGSSDTVGDGIDVRCRSGEGLRFEHINVIGFPESGIHYRYGGIPLYIDDIHVFGNGMYGLNLERTGADTWNMVALHGISGDANNLALIRIFRAGAVFETFHIVDVKAEAVGTHQPVVILLDTLNGGLVSIENVSITQSQSGVIQDAIRIVGTGSARVHATNIRCSGCTNILTETQIPVSYAYSGLNAIWWVYHNGSFQYQQASGQSLKALSLGKFVAPPQVGGTLYMEPADSGSTNIKIRRFTDSNPSARFLDFTKRSGESLFYLDHIGRPYIPSIAPSGTMSLCIDSKGKIFAAPSCTP